jgi:hypothetical protein
MLEQTKIILELNERHFSNRQIEEKTSIPYQTIRSTLKKYSRCAWRKPSGTEEFSRKGINALPLPAFHPVAKAILPKLQSLEEES